MLRKKRETERKKDEEKIEVCVEPKERRTKRTEDRGTKTGQLDTCIMTDGHDSNSCRMYLIREACD